VIEHDLMLAAVGTHCQAAALSSFGFGFLSRERMRAVHFGGMFDHAQSFTPTRSRQRHQQMNMSEYSSKPGSAQKRRN
jgi:hypothetical protein